MLVRDSIHEVRPVRSRAAHAGRSAAALAVALLAGCATMDCPQPEAAPPPSVAAAPPVPQVGPEVMVVATIHKGHLVQPGYPLAHLKRIVDRFRPDLVLVEIRPEPFALGHLEDGPFEMTYVVDHARRARIPVAPIDWWREDEVAAEPAIDPLDRALLAKELAKMPEPEWPAFDVANAKAERQRALRVLNATARLGGGNPIWTRRQAYFDAQALAAIETHGAKRVLAFVGYAHAPELEGYLRSFGSSTVDPLSIMLDPKSAEEKAPDSVVTLWREGLARLEETRAPLSGPKRRTFDLKVRYFAIAVAREGRCCVAASELEVPEARPQP